MYVYKLREQLAGKAAIARYLARIDSKHSFTGNSVLESVQVLLLHG